MEKKEQLYEGKAKKVFATDDPNLVIVDYKDDATAFNGLKKGSIAGKGVINNVMSNHMFQLLEKQGVPTHFVEQLSERETLVKKVSIVPLEVIIRNISAGSFAKRFGVEEGIVSDEPDHRVLLQERRSGRPADERLPCGSAQGCDPRGDRDHQVHGLQGKRGHEAVLRLAERYPR